MRIGHSFQIVLCEALSVRRFGKEKLNVIIPVGGRHKHGMVNGRTRRNTQVREKLHACRLTRKHKHSPVVFGEIAFIGKFSDIREHHVVHHVVTVDDRIEAAKIGFTPVIEERAAETAVELSVGAVVKVKIVVFTLHDGEIYVCPRYSQPRDGVAVYAAARGENIFTDRDAERLGGRRSIGALQRAFDIRPDGCDQLLLSGVGFADILVGKVNVVIIPVSAVAARQDERRDHKKDRYYKEKPLHDALLFFFFDFFLASRMNITAIITAITAMQMIRNVPSAERIPVAGGT